MLDDRTLEFPDYPGNNLFNSLGNIAGHPHAGLVFADFATGDVLQLTGRARLLGETAVTVRIDVEEVLETPAALPIRFAPVEPSPAYP